MLIVGLTGGIASGKSTVSSRLTSPPHSLPLIDLDVLARQVVEPGSSVLRRIAHHFGHDRVVNPDGSLNRPELARIVFNSDSQRKVLNSIIHPAIQKVLLWTLVKYWITGHKMVIIDSPLLIESNTWRACGHIIVVYCSEQVQLSRLRTRNPELSMSQAQLRIKAQQPLADKIVYADSVLDNSGTRLDLDRQVDTIVKQLKQTTGGPMWLASWLVPPFGLLWGALIVVVRLYIKGVGKPRRRHSSRSSNLAGSSQEHNGVAIEMQPLRPRPKES